MAHLEVLGKEVGAIPKGYLYFTIVFSLAVEAINMKMRSKHREEELQD
jgi:predicted tellurium resistance membrane protein TerC